MYLKYLGTYLELRSGIDPIEFTFRTCDDNIDDQLNEAEINQGKCREALETVFGITEEWLETVSSKIDSNADRKITLEEARLAFERFEDLNRKDDSCDWEVVRSYRIPDLGKATQIATDCISAGGSLIDVARCTDVAMEGEFGGQWFCIYGPYFATTSINTGAFFIFGYRNPLDFYCESEYPTKLDCVLQQ